MNYGTISAQDIFDKAIDDTITGLNGVLHIRDDFIIFGCSENEHNAALRAFLTRFEECGLTLSPRKCKIGVPEIEFFGLRFSKDGVSPSASKVKALQSMDRPKNASEVRSLLGMAQYSAQFIPGYAAMTTSLRSLTHNDIPWTWGEKEETAFRDLTQLLSAYSVLGYYQVGLETNLMVDAGPTGLGLLLLQKSDDRWKPILCASRRLTETEQRYCQLEREALTIRWACERCYTYLIGSTFTVLSDHEYLESLMNNANSRPPMRIERWLMYLQQFDFKVKYIPGKINGTDYLSRHAMPLSPKDRRSVSYREATVRQLVLSVVPRAVSLTEIQTATAHDPQLMKLLPLLLSGDKEGVKADSTISQFHQVFDELSHAENVILRGSQIVVHTALQDRVLEICHEAHPGIVKSKQLLHSKVWFTGIDKKMEAKISGCIPCQAAIPRKQRDPLGMTKMPCNKLPRMTGKRCHEEVSGRDAVMKEKRKSCANNHRPTRYHDLRSGEIVIANQQKTNKFSMTYDPVPYKEDVNVDAPVSDDVIADDVIANDVIADDVIANDVIADDEPPDDVIADNVIADDEPPDDTVPDDVIADDVVVHN